MMGTSEKRWSNWFQFRLKTVFVLTLLVAAFFGGMTTQRRLGDRADDIQRLFLPIELVDLSNTVAWTPDRLSPDRRSPDRSSRDVPAVVTSVAEVSNELAAANADAPSSAIAPADDGKLRIICFGAHPDDCELQAGGTAMLWAAEGHHVKFVSVTNGDIGHWREAGGPLAVRRKAEVAQADHRLHVTSEVLDIHDGELLPTLENRRTITRLIREWRADVVISHRPNDYHPDHRTPACWFRTRPTWLPSLFSAQTCRI
jgi:hypothetical protein